MIENIAGFKGDMLKLCEDSYTQGSVNACKALISTLQQMKDENSVSEMKTEHIIDLVEGIQDMLAKRN